MILSRLFGKKAKGGPKASTHGRLIYAVGDVHGRLDVLQPLLGDIVEDALQTAPPEPPLLLMLGDYVDRGPASKGVVDLIREMQGYARFETCVLKGNHEEALLQFLGDPQFGATWLDHGAAATLLSYGVTPPTARTDSAAWVACRDAFAAALPPEHLSFYKTLELLRVEGDYAFAHAGIRPGVPLVHQSERDLLWIRHEFINDKSAHEKVIVHGHTPMEEAQLTRYRLGVDTGAYATGVLTAVRLYGEDQRLMQAKAKRPGA